MLTANFLRTLGPSLLYAGAAVGVSHLVQSTSAGAQFGFGLVWAVLVANFFKYPFFEMGPRYTTLTGKSILEGYRAIGKWAVGVFIALTLATMFCIQAAVTVVTAGIAEHITGWNLGMPLWSSILVLICAALLCFGRFSLLDNAMKTIIILLSVSTIISLIGALFNSGNTHLTPELTFDFGNNAHLLFLIALMGWMPAPIDVSVWHSEWTVANLQGQKTKPGLKEATFAFHIGYWGTALLALGFLSLGALVIYRSGNEIPASGVAFAALLIKLYTSNLGEWAKPIIAIAALTTMFSTTLTCLDAFPRILARSVELLRSNKAENTRKPYLIWLGFTVIGTLLIFRYFLPNMKAMVSLATTLSFITAPLVAWLNLKVNARLPKNERINGFTKVVALIGMVYLCGFSLYFLIRQVLL